MRRSCLLLLLLVDYSTSWPGESGAGGVATIIMATTTSSGLLKLARECGNHSRVRQSCLPGATTKRNETPMDGGVTVIVVVVVEKE